MKQNTSNHTTQQGSAHVVIVVCLVLALVTALGWIFWQNFILKEPAQKDTEVVVVDKNREAKDGDTDQAPVYAYTDYRKNKQDTTGVVIKTQNDVDKLDAASDKLKAYFKKRVGKEVKGVSGEIVEVQFTVDRVYGDYAVGPGYGHYAVWGPEESTGPIMEVAGAQQIGMPCDKLRVAKVPSELVDGKCRENSQAGLVPYAL